jgi:hypothetical protein
MAMGKLPKPRDISAKANNANGKVTLNAGKLKQRVSTEDTARRLKP